MDMIGNVEIVSYVGSDKRVKRLPPYIKLQIRATAYLTLNTKIAFTQLRKAFTKDPIFCHFDLECHIKI